MADLIGTLPANLRRVQCILRIGTVCLVRDSSITPYLDTQLVTAVVKIQFDTLRVNRCNLWGTSRENRDLRQLLRHRHRLVQMRTRIMNPLQAVSMNEGVRRKTALWSKPGRAQLESLPLAP